MPFMISYSTSSVPAAVQAFPTGGGAAGTGNAAGAWPGSGDGVAQPPRGQVVAGVADAEGRALVAEVGAAVAD